MRTLKAFLGGFDSYERHRLVASKIPDASMRILDVGGRIGQLNNFCNNPITVMNLSHGDLLGNGIYSPFKTSAFDVVISLDVLEHIPSECRLAFIQELIRVAKSRVIFCTPYGSPQHEEVEREIYSALEKQGITNIMLSEHVQYGLPSVDFINASIPNQFSRSILYSGDYRYNRLLFDIDHWMGSRFKYIKIGLSIFLNVFGNLFVYPFTLKKHPSFYTNRIVVEIEK